MDHSVDTVIQKIAECIPYEDSSTVDYSDPDWSTNEFEWNEDYENPNKTESKSEEVPF
jgi:hypothetical protein